jgi:hypothetical protein
VLFFNFQPEERKMFVILREDEKPDRIEAAATTIYQLDSRKGFLRVLKAPFIGPLFLPLPEALQHMLEKLADESPEKQNEFLVFSAK